jgi:hypothetical protein
MELREELRGAPDRRRIRQLTGALTKTFEQFLAARQAAR